jgi:hypothetical protein
MSKKSPSRTSAPSGAPKRRSRKLPPSRIVVYYNRSRSRLILLGRPDLDGLSASTQIFRGTNELAEFEHVGSMLQKF